ncbi:MAG: peptidase S10 [Burkholderiales bacterium]|nr:peptidase S10 [Burkholderiales bacterium]
MPPPGPGDSAYSDPATYSAAPGAALPGAVEAAAITHHSLLLDGVTLAYTATAGHLIARDAASGVAEASMFYVAYTVDGADPATRPVTFFYNGGPGSASVWLHLGSFAPVRLATGVPATTAATPFALVANHETLLGSTDLVFVDAVGTGLSEALAPATNQTFWGVDADAAVFRDFILRWLAANGRGGSPKFLYGESYGGPRTAVLAGLLQRAGVTLTGLVLQSPALDYNSNCGITGAGNCGANLPSYAAIGDAQGLLNPTPPDLDAYAGQMRGLADARYEPAVAALLAAGTPPPADLPPLLAADTGIAQGLWQSQFNLFPGTFQGSLLPGRLIGRYDGRMSAALGSPLAADGDPSSTFITPSFTSTIVSYLRDTLRYDTGSTYVVVGNAIDSWNFSHAGRPLPDTVPDLAADLAAEPALRVLMVGGYDDLATPFHVTEGDLARLGPDAPVQTRIYPGGHMSYLDDATRVRQQADVQAFLRGALVATGAMGPTLAGAGSAAAPQAHPRGIRRGPAPDQAGVPPTQRLGTPPEPALQAPLGDPWVPPRVLQAARLGIAAPAATAARAASMAGP